MHLCVLKEWVKEDNGYEWLLVRVVREWLKEDKGYNWLLLQSYG